MTLQAEPTNDLGPYAQTADTYHQAGWHPFPVVGKAGHVPERITGRQGINPGRADVLDWAIDRGDDNIAVRLDGVVGIDIDAYDKDGTVKTGDRTLALAEQQWGPLPPTWSSTARGADSAARIKFYRAPTGYLYLATGIKLADPDTGGTTGDIEIIQFHHRYAVVWPSVHPDTRTTYRWYRPNGSTAGYPPNVSALPELPKGWLDALTEQAQPDPDRDPVDIPPQRADRGDWHPLVTADHARAIQELHGGTGSRHDATLANVGRLARHEEQGRPGATTALEDLRNAFVVTVDRSGRDTAANEYDRMVASSRRQAATTTSLDDLVAEVFANLPTIDPPTGHHTPTDPPVWPHPDTTPDDLGLNPEDIAPVLDQVRHLRIRDAAARLHEAQRGEAIDVTSRLHPGGSILDEPDTTPAVWGNDPEVFWAEGESLVLAAPTGAGKTTIGSQLVAGMIGHPSYTEVLDQPIAEKQRVLFIAADRPRQIKRVLRTRLNGLDRAHIDDRLAIWSGPLPVDLGQDPTALLKLCRQAGADTVVLDSLKDVAVKLTDDAVGSNLNAAMQHCLAEDIDVLAMHHQRKGQNGAIPNTIADVYGSTWITAGAGSVVLLWGAPGDAVVDLFHLKQPAETLGPWKIEHDHASGHTIRVEGFDCLAFLTNRAATGADAKETARAWLNKHEPDKNEIAKAYRKLEALRKRGLAEVVDKGRRGGAAGSGSKRFRVLLPNHAPNHGAFPE